MAYLDILTAIFIFLPEISQYYFFHIKIIYIYFLLIKQYISIATFMKKNILRIKVSKFLLTILKRKVESDICGWQFRV